MWVAIAQGKLVHEETSVERLKAVLAGRKAPWWALPKARWIVLVRETKAYPPIGPWRSNADLANDARSDAVSVDPLAVRIN
jgi:hypothetical protein